MEIKRRQHDLLPSFLYEKILKFFEKGYCQKQFSVLNC